MSTSNAYRFLTSNSGSDDRLLALKMFWGEVLEAYRIATVVWDMAGSVVSIKRIQAGKSWEFPILGDDPAPEYHIPGTELLGQTQQFGAGTITIDDILVGHRDVPLDQMLMSHFDVISPFAKAIGRGIAIQMDSKLLRMALLAARTAAVSGIHNGGNIVFRQATGSTLLNAYPASTTGAANFRDDAAQLAQLMDEDNVPKAGRYLIIPPLIRRVLTKDTTLFSHDYQSGPNVLNSRVIGELEGFQVIVSNNMPATNLTTGNPPSNTTKYNVDARYANASAGLLGQPAGIALCGADEGSAAVGLVEAMGITPYMEDDGRRNTKFLKAQNFVGMGVLSPWCAGAICGGNI